MGEGRRRSGDKCGTEVKQHELALLRGKEEKNVNGGWTGRKGDENDKGNKTGCQ